ncbi:MAG: hypothetical protein OXK76_08610 [Gammaproteobacteria bacterium]|nr:hypothetical protein [Gammaproteobacteria bacterium]
MPRNPQDFDIGMLHSKVHAIGATLSAGLGKVGRRFVDDMLLGMLISGSVRLTEIARALGESIPTHATHKRLSRNLGNARVGDVVADNLLAEGVGVVRDNALLVIDLFEVVKPYAEKMEYVNSPLPDGKLSDDARPKHRANRGYHVCEIFGWDVHGGPLQRYQELARQMGSEPDPNHAISAWDNQVVTPLAQTLFSPNAPAFKSESDEILDLVQRVDTACQRRCLFAIDTVGLLQPKQSLMRHSVELLAKQRGLPELLAAATNCRFAARVPGDFPLLHGRLETTARELGESCETPYGVTLYKHQSDVDIGLFVHFGALPVRLPASPAKPLWLVAVKGMAGEPRPAASDLDPFVVLTTEPMPRNRRVIGDFVWSFLSYWDAIQTNQAIKGQFDFDDVRVLTYDRLRNLGILVLAASFVESQWPGIALTKSLFPAPRGRSFQFYRAEIPEEETPSEAG